MPVLGLEDAQLLHPRVPVHVQLPREADRLELLDPTLAQFTLCGHAHVRPCHTHARRHASRAWQAVASSTRRQPAARGGIATSAREHAVPTPKTLHLVYACARRLRLNASTPCLMSTPQLHRNSTHQVLAAPSPPTTGTGGARAREDSTLRYLTRWTATQTPRRLLGPIWHGEQWPTRSLKRTSSRNRCSSPHTHTQHEARHQRGQCASRSRWGREGEARRAKRWADSP